jgi:hypothetical protein
MATFKSLCIVFKTFFGISLVRVYTNFLGTFIVSLSVQNSGKKVCFGVKTGGSNSSETYDSVMFEPMLLYLYTLTLLMKGVNKE